MEVPHKPGPGVASSKFAQFCRYLCPTGHFLGKGLNFDENIS
jgi:hypothetical protein